ncbi:short-chain dehydrogenase [Vibrio nigripulchritudo]|uniref:SDR family NAD(P)-dependent oxidoreductase n=1 Tax=Vibrio nigripulchritudo TaxID=28173 RepID=UPI00190A5ADA|nr:SDR family oxidoreductase [Vibrio nigripulchritudo]BCL72377.1 short-chain dehydrogenase [Vibrio nigripulchritudo]BDU33738.1 short-chain dehydrogenase [Vibrio nigripulchritudo]
MNGNSAKAVLVTGGSRGIGRAMVDRFLSAGYKVAFFTNDEQSCESTLADHNHNENLMGITLDVSNAEAVKAGVEKAVAAFERLDVVINSAGIQRYGDVVDTSVELWNEVIGVNLNGVFHTCKYAIPEIRKQGKGAIINIASVQSYASQTGVAAYAASKGAILQLTRSMALDCAADQITVNALCPASVNTPMLHWAADLWKGDKTQEAVLDSWAKAHPLGRVAEPSELAELALFIAEGKCAFMTGADIRVDGGVMSQVPIILPE